MARPFRPAQRWIAIASVAGLAAVLAAAACSTTTIDSRSSAAEDKRIADLNEVESATLCDYFAARFGGYGASSGATCDAGTTSTRAPATQSTCVQGFLLKIPDTCPMKVSEAEACFRDLAAPSCDSAAVFPPSCLLLTQAICGPAMAIVTAPVPDRDSGAPDAPVEASSTNACPGNTKQKTPFINATCQSALEKDCCAELTACFAIVAAQGDCNAYSACIPRCRFKSDGVTPETDAAKISACQDDCDLVSPKNVVTAYETIATCTTNHPATNAACQ